MSATIKLDAVELDTSIQCRAVIDTALVNEYAEQAGHMFPPIDVYGTKAKCWIGDGWHRVLAARQRGDETIQARLSPGGRKDALKHALGANALHGHRRSNADKRRSVEIALREFPKLSSRAVAKMCGVSDPFVNAMRSAQVQTVSTSECTGQDGKQYPARKPKEDVVPEPAKDVVRNPHLWKFPAADEAGQITRAIETIESMTEILAASNLPAADATKASDWADRLRKCRTAVTRLIARCEEA